MSTKYEIAVVPINNLNMTPLPLLTYMLTEALNKIMKIK
jgi:hypothetical protein